MPSPPIEKRDAGALRELGRALAEGYCPAWSSWDSDDAGQAFLAALAAMQERVFERLNRFPEKVFIELLRILGLELRMPTAARALITCQPVPGRSEGRWVPRATSVQAEVEPGVAPIRFTTEEDLLVSQTRLAAVIARRGRRYRDWGPAFLPPPVAKDGGVEVFENLRPMRRRLYVSDPCLATLAGPEAVELRLETAGTLPVAVRDAIRWQWFDGQEWVPLPGVPVRDALFLRAEAFSALAEGEELRLFIFSGLDVGDVRDYLLWEYYSKKQKSWQPLQAEPFEGGFWPGERGVKLTGGGADLAARKEFGESQDGIWLRTRLDTVPHSPVAPPLYRVGTGIAPSAAEVRQIWCGPADGDGETVRLDHTQPFEPLSAKPQREMACYFDLAGLELEGGRVRLDLSVVPEHQAGPSRDLVLVYEYFDGAAWLLLGRSTRFGISGSYMPHYFIDETRALSRSGSVGFARPADMMRCHVEDAFGAWVRIRIRSGSYKAPPKLAGVRCSADLVPRDIQKAVIVRNAIASDITEAVVKARPEPWPPQLGEQKSLFGFTGPLARAGENGPGLRSLPEVALDLGEEEPRRAVYIRAELPPLPVDLVCERVLVRAQSGWEGRLPQALFTTSNGSFFDAPGIGEVFAPFGLRPAVEGALYVRLAEAAPGARVNLRFELNRPPRAAYTRELRLVWECYDGEEWRGIAWAEVGWLKGAKDSTDMLTRAGSVELTLPDEVAPRSVRGQQGYWLRVRITAGGYGSPPAYEGLRLDYFPPQRPVAEAVLEEELGLRDVSAGEFPLFAQGGDEDPHLAFAFTPAPRKERLQMFVEVEERLVEQAESLAADYFSRERRERGRASPQKPVWEVLGPDGFQPLHPRDDTDFLQRTGMLAIIPPGDWEPRRWYGREACWLRLRLPRGHERELPAQLHYLLNTVPASHCEQVEDEVLGGGDGERFQSLRLRAVPVLGALRLTVREPTAPAPFEREKLVARDPDAVEEVRDADGELTGCWVLWEEVKTFIESGPRDRHYQLDRLHGIVRFGDGRRGRMPPVGADTVVARAYRAGGGADGNLDAGALTRLETALPGLARVFNPLPASGGSALGSLAEVRRRGPQLLRHRERAVSAEDIAWLVPLAFPLVSRVLCRTRENENGLVDVFLVPRGEREPWDVPTALLRDVRSFLLARCQPAFRLSVSAPRFVCFDLRAVVVLEPGEGDEEARERIAAAARTWFDPRVGGPDGEGWPFGRECKVVEVLRALRRLPEVAAIYGGELIVGGLKRARILLGDAELPRLVEVEVVPG